MVGTSWMKVWWIAYNRKLFDGDLPTPLFLVKDLKHFGEYFQGAITLSSNISTIKDAKATLIHEMVHQWQDFHNKSIDHGHEFQTWRELILEQTGLEI